MILQTYDIIKTAEQYSCIDGQLSFFRGASPLSRKPYLIYTRILFRIRTLFRFPIIPAFLLYYDLTEKSIVKRKKADADKNVCFRILQCG